ncbi:hypothetical protein K3495_g1693 [Podosphaera aphanis]|nr:hypothetical protein K3495_g1693 [Podosphaera aphanis]
MMVGIAVKILPVELSNNEPEDILQKSVTTSHVRLYVTSTTANYTICNMICPTQQTNNEFEIPQEPNVPSTEDEEPTELVKAEVEIILERSTTESRDAPTVAASPIDHALSTTNESAHLSSTMSPPPP